MPTTSAVPDTPANIAAAGAGSYTVAMAGNFQGVQFSWLTGRPQKY